MLSRFDFFKLETDHLFFFSDWGAWADFFQELKLGFFGQSESIYFFVTTKSLPYNNCYHIHSTLNGSNMKIHCPTLVKYSYCMIC